MQDVYRGEAIIDRLHENYNLHNDGENAEQAILAYLKNMYDAIRDQRDVIKGYLGIPETTRSIDRITADKKDGA